MLTTKDIYMKACIQSTELHVMTDEERLKLQAHLREMYKEIEKVCIRHNLKMCAGYGTVLGALRHNGFIPWDDDVDLLMPRIDYDLFVNNYASELPIQYKVFAPNGENGAICRFAKVVDTSTRFLGPGAEDDEKHGIFIDIFPMEFAPTNRIKLNIRNQYIRFLILVAESVVEYEHNNLFYKKLMCSTSMGKITYNLRRAIGSFFSFRKGVEWYNQIAKYEYYEHPTGQYNIPSDGGVVKSLIPLSEEIYFPAQKVPFDDIEMYVPRQSVKYLEHNYGDWKCVPPIEKRWQHFIKEVKFTL